MVGGAAPEIANPVVPKNVASGLRVIVRGGGGSISPDDLTRFLGVGVQLQAELSGPGLPAAITLGERAPGDPPSSDPLLVKIPSLTTAGDYLLSNLRLVAGGRVVLDVTPSRVPLKVIEQVLITSVVTRPLTLQEIRDKGIVLEKDDVLGFDFTVALKLESTPIQITFPAVFDREGVPIPTGITPPMLIEREDVPVPTVVPMMLSVEDTSGFLPTPTLKLPDGRQVQVKIPALLVIPGNVGFLKQFFSAQLYVQNGAPAGSNLVVHDVTGTIVLPNGDDDLPHTADDPLSLPATKNGPQSFTQPVRGVGPDGVPATADDVGALKAAETGQVEFLLRGDREGYHTISFDIAATLEGLATGPVTVKGHGSGGVLVRNPYFDVTFSAPSIVRRGEPFTLNMTLTNIGQGAANALTVAIDASRMSGLHLAAGASGTQTVDTIVTGDSKTLKFNFVSDRTGQVVAHYLRFDPQGAQATGQVNFTVGVGERGVPLSPDTLVLPTVVDNLPTDLVDAAMRVLGQAWSIANAPVGSLPPSIIRTSKTGVTHKALALAEAGLRVNLGQPLGDAIRDFGLDFYGGSPLDNGFDQLLRDTDAGHEFANALGAALEAPVAQAGGSSAWQRALADVASSGADLVSFAVSHVADLALTDGSTLTTTPAGAAQPSSAVRSAVFVPLGDPHTSPFAGLITAPTATPYTLSFTGVNGSALDLSVAVPRGDGSVVRGSNPTTPTEVLPAAPVTAIGYPYDLVGEETSPLTSGRVVALTTGPIGVPYRPSNVFLYDVATDQPQWIGAVTLGNSPSDGVTRRTVMKDGILYAVTAGIGKGIQIVDLEQTMANFQAATANGPTSREYFEMLSQLGLEGQGFGQSAIVQTIFVPTGTGENSRLWDLAVGDITLDGASTRIVAATGASALVLANPLTGEMLFNGSVPFADGSSALVWGYGVALMKSGTQDIAAVVGFKTSAADVRLVTIDLSDPRHPKALSSLPLSGTEFDQRARLLTKDGLLYVGGHNATLLINITDPAHPRRDGVVAGVAGNLALTSDPLVFGIGSSANGASGGVKVGVVNRFVYLAPIEPTVVKVTDALPGPDIVETLAARTLKVLAFGIDVVSAGVELLENVSVKLNVPLAAIGNAFVGLVPKGTQFARNAPVNAVARIQDRETFIGSAPRKLDLGEVTLTVDANNDTELTDADETAKREGKAWAFWEANPNNIGTEDGMVDLATIRLSLKVGTKALRMRLRGRNAATTWSLSRKVPVPSHPETKAYLANTPPTGQLLFTRNVDNCVVPMGHCLSENGDPITLRELSKGNHEFLIRCEKCPRDETRLLELEFAENPSDPSLLDAAKTDIRPLREWMSVLSARPTADFASVSPYSPTPELHLLDGYAPVPPDTKNLTVIIHGYNVSEQEATRSFFPTYVKRLYWAGQPMIAAQGGDQRAHTVGISWPSDFGITIFGLGTSFYFPEDEFHAFQTGVPVARFLGRVKANTGAVINVLTHSLGSVVINTALMRPELGGAVIDRVIMSEATVPMEALSDQYTPRTEELRALGTHALILGYNDDIIWQQQWSQMQAGLPLVGGQPDYSDLFLWNLRTQSNPFVTPAPQYENRWRQTRPPDGPADIGLTQEPQRGPWRGFFAQNRTRTTFVNVFNTNDAALNTFWVAMNFGKKPNDGGRDDRSLKFWATLPNTGAEESYLWSGPPRGNIIRQWAELAHWFPSVSFAAGTGCPPSFAAENCLDFSAFGEGSVLSSTQTHSFLHVRPFADVWSAFQQLRPKFAVPPQGSQ